MISDSAREAARKDTLKHIDRVRSLLLTVTSELIRRGHHHDASKLQEPELSLFAEWGPKLKQMEYGSDEYRAALKQMGVALQHHYECSPHHPEHFKNGVDGMTLVDVLEMVCDWKASSERVKDGDFLKSLEINAKRFNLSPQLTQIIENTGKLLSGEAVKLQW